MRTQGRSQIELSATLAAIRRLAPKEQPRFRTLTDAERELMASLMDELKSTVGNMEPRTLANSIFHATTLGSADKNLLKSGVHAIQQLCVFHNLRRPCHAWPAAVTLAALCLC